MKEDTLQIHDYISRLLFDHECVVVPGFGAFLTRYYPAEVNQATHMMRPPSRRVHFNKSIKENDGLLAKSISLSESKPYDMALATITKEVEEWKKLLATGKKLKLPGVGRLYLDEASKNIQFSPSVENNYLTSSYGLSIFRSPAIQREESIRKNIHKTIEKHIVTETKRSTQQKTQKAKKSRRIPWAAVLAPVIFAGVVGAAYYTYQQNGFENLSGINWFQFNRSAETEEPVEEDTNIAAEEPTEKEETSTSESSTADFASEEASETSSSETPAYTEAETAPVAGGFHIVVGSFKDQENAGTYAQQLESKGFDPYLAAGDQRFYRVAVGNFSSRSQALDALQSIRQNINSQAWVYAN